MSDPAPLPPLPELEDVRGRLAAIFPEGIRNRGYAVREMAAATVFAMLYVGAVEGRDRWVSPKYVYSMSDEQAARGDDASRAEYDRRVRAPGFVPLGRPWYRDNTREPIRDETLRSLVELGAVVERAGVPTTSSKGRYALRPPFAGLFDPELTAEALGAAIAAWQSASLSPGALARVQLLRGTGDEVVLVRFPNGETRRMSPGPSSLITRGVVEDFAVRFLRQPAVVWVSESGNKVVQRDDDLARRIGLDIDAQQLLPDVILADLGEPFRIVFAEVVATDGPVTPARRTELARLARNGGHEMADLAFVTAFRDRDDPAFRKALPALAWGSFAWTLSEPEHLLVLREGRPERRVYLPDLS